MAKEKVIEFLNEAAQNQDLKNKLQTVKNPDELTTLAQKEGFEFSSKNVDEALDELKQKPGFFGKLAEAIAEAFSPDHDNAPPAIGVQPYSGDSSK
ncbi:Nif11-like leader peptide family natural product precursor [Crocosphaera sp. XPORK-15E]|uniref:Nif11-like leader peptide family natural product precursor n=1 Tax=Crocosphaera sp. XPORK-15E TaxID=3110247 RepID=UPI002B22076D|nr:Nif11-like leader peptide family natural product precursor [Crocosphaera sp. XPORK-15E]MEA5534552.1 Nif11-like leader peptide family natural product precursor [Crocosphaera sp. XPORK-15E]